MTRLRRRASSGKVGRERGVPGTRTRVGAREALRPGEGGRGPTGTGTGVGARPAGRSDGRGVASKEGAPGGVESREEGLLLQHGGDEEGGGTWLTLLELMW